MSRHCFYAEFPVVLHIVSRAHHRYHPVGVPTFLLLHAPCHNQTTATGILLLVFVPFKPAFCSKNPPSIIVRVGLCYLAQVLTS